MKTKKDTGMVIFMEMHIQMDTDKDMDKEIVMNADKMTTIGAEIDTDKDTDTDTLCAFNIHEDRDYG